MFCRGCGGDKPLDEFYPGRKKCKDCKKRQVDRNRREKWEEHYKAKNKTYKNPSQMIEWRVRTRSSIIAAYGGMCQCCGETEEVFLTFDHINGGGTQLRKGGMIADTLLRHLRDNHPEDIQVLCHNCNWAKFRLGVCPHQETTSC